MSRSLSCRCNKNMCHGALFRKSCKGSDGERKHEKNKDTPWTHQICLFSCLNIWEQPAKRNLQHASHIQEKSVGKRVAATNHKRPAILKVSLVIDKVSSSYQASQLNPLSGSFFGEVFPLKTQTRRFLGVAKMEEKKQKPDLSGFQAGKHKNNPKTSRIQTHAQNLPEPFPKPSQESNPQKPFPKLNPSPKEPTKPETKKPTPPSPSPENGCLKTASGRPPGWSIYEVVKQKVCRSREMAKWVKKKTPTETTGGWVYFSFYQKVFWGTRYFWPTPKWREIGQALDKRNDRIHKILLSKHIFFARRLDAFQEGIRVLVPCLEKKVLRWREKLVENKTVLLSKTCFYIKVCLWNNATFESVAI